MCSFPKDPTGGLFDFNKDGKLDATEYSMMLYALSHDKDEDADDIDDIDFEDTEDPDEEDVDDEADDDDSF